MTFLSICHYGWFLCVLLPSSHAALTGSCVFPLYFHDTYFITLCPQFRISSFPSTIFRLLLCLPFTLVRMSWRPSQRGINYSTKLRGGNREIGQLAKCLSRKHEDLSLISRTHVKIWACVRDRRIVGGLMASQAT